MNGFVHLLSPFLFLYLLNRGEQFYDPPSTQLPTHHKPCKHFKLKAKSQKRFFFFHFSRSRKKISRWPRFKNFQIERVRERERERWKNPFKNEPNSTTHPHQNLKAIVMRRRVSSQSSDRSRTNPTRFQAFEGKSLNLPSNSTPKQLNELLNKLIGSEVSEKYAFYVGEDAVPEKEELGSVVKDTGISTESVVDDSDIRNSHRFVFAPCRDVPILCQVIQVQFFTSHSVEMEDC